MFDTDAENQLTALFHGRYVVTPRSARPTRHQKEKTGQESGRQTLPAQEEGLTRDWLGVITIKTMGREAHKLSYCANEIPTMS